MSRASAQSRSSFVESETKARVSSIEKPPLLLKRSLRWASKALGEPLIQDDAARSLACNWARRLSALRAAGLRAQAASSASRRLVPPVGAVAPAKDGTGRGGAIWARASVIAAGTNSDAQTSRDNRKEEKSSKSVLRSKSRLRRTFALRRLEKERLLKRPSGQRFTTNEVVVLHLGRSMLLGCSWLTQKVGAGSAAPTTASLKRRPSVASMSLAWPQWLQVSE